MSVKNPAHLYEVSFFSALWMVFPESWQRRVADFYAHDCMTDIKATIPAITVNVAASWKDISISRTKTEGPDF